MAIISSGENGVLLKLDLKCVYSSIFLLMKFINLPELYNVLIVLGFGVF